MIRAYSSTQARSFVAEKAFSVEVASQETLIQTLGMGVKVVDAAKPETADAFDGGQCGTPCPEEKPQTAVDNIDRAPQAFWNGGEVEDQHPNEEG